MLAFISDLHSNTEALSVVLAEIERLGVERILCLGDVIGYGPEPREVLRTVMEVCEFSLLGNHEQGCMFYASDFNPRARAAIDWTRDQLNLRDADRDENSRFWNYLDSMPKEHREGDLLLVHGSPRDPVREYMVPEDVHDGAKMAGCFGRFGDARACMIGHSHVPGVFVENGPFLSPGELENNSYRLDGDRVMVNVGSVGQPRDGDTRTCFTTLDGDLLTFHRLEYDFAATQAKIRAIPELPNYLADRLGVGR